jgi:hypothetical protein
MLITEKSLALNEAVQQMGFTSVEDFALEKTKESLLMHIAESMRRINLFHEKYGVDYIDFCKQFHSLHQPVFEKEEDSAEWNAEIKQRELLLQKLSRLE